MFDQYFEFHKKRVTMLVAVNTRMRYTMYLERVYVTLVNWLNAKS